MSKDLTISAKSYHDQVNTNQIGYKNESIGDSILPHLVKRARLNPTVKTNEIKDENGETINIEQNIEMRHYYSLHNDASKAVYVSPTIRLENSIEDGVHTDIPGKPDEIIQPDVLNPPNNPYIPIDPENPNPTPGPLLPPDDVIIPPIFPIITEPDPDDPPYEPGNLDDNNITIIIPDGPIGEYPPGIIIENITVTPGGNTGNGSSGGSFTIGGSSGGKGTTGGGWTGPSYWNPNPSIMPVGKNNFDYYAELLVQNKGGFANPYKLTQVDEVTKFYEDTSYMTTAVEAFKDSGITSFGPPTPVSKLDNGKSMFNNAKKLTVINHTFPELIDATTMAANCPQLVTFEMKGAHNVSTISDIVLNSNLLKKVKFDLGEKGSAVTSTSSKGLFEGKTSLDTAEIPIHRLENIDKIFKDCTNLVNIDVGFIDSDKKISHTTSAVEAFSNAIHVDVKNQSGSPNTFASIIQADNDLFAIVKNATSMFANNYRLRRAKLYLPKATNVNKLFALDDANKDYLSTAVLDISSATNLDNMFLNNTKELTKLILKFGNTLPVTPPSWLNLDTSLFGKVLWAKYTLSNKNASSIGQFFFNKPEISRDHRVVLCNDTNLENADTLLHEKDQNENLTVFTPPYNHFVLILNNTENLNSIFKSLKNKSDLILCCNNVKTCDSAFEDTTIYRFSTKEQYKSDENIIQTWDTEDEFTLIKGATAEMHSNFKYLTSAKRLLANCRDLNKIDINISLPAKQIDFSEFCKAEAVGELSPLSGEIIIKGEQEDTVVKCNLNNAFENKSIHNLKLDLPYVSLDEAFKNCNRALTIYDKENDGSGSQFTTPAPLNKALTLNAQGIESANSAFEGSSLKDKWPDNITFANQFRVTSSVKRLLANCYDLTDVDIELPGATHFGGLCAFDKEVGSEESKILMRNKNLWSFKFTSRTSDENGKKELNYKYGDEDNKSGIVTNCDSLSVVHLNIPLMNEFNLDEMIVSCPKILGREAGEYDSSTNSFIHLVSDAGKITVNSENLTDAKLYISDTAGYKTLLNEIKNNAQIVKEHNGRSSTITDLTINLPNYTKNSGYDTVGYGFYEKMAGLTTTNVNLPKISANSLKGFFSYNSTLTNITGTLGSAGNKSNNIGSIFRSCKKITNQTCNIKINSDNSDTTSNLVLWLDDENGVDCKLAFSNCESLTHAHPELIKLATSTRQMYLFGSSGKGKITTAYFNMPKCADAYSMYANCPITEIIEDENNPIELSSLENAGAILYNSRLDLVQACKFIKEFVHGGKAYTIESNGSTTNLIQIGILKGNVSIENGNLITSDELKEKLAKILKDNHGIYIENFAGMEAADFNVTGPFHENGRNYYNLFTRAATTDGKGTLVIELMITE